MGGAVRRFDLPPMAVYQSQMYWLTHCYRGQAPSHIFIAFQSRFGVRHFVATGSGLSRCLR
ncbi:hypothetical protein DYL61_19435 [Pseudomonas nabeulensis]|uniref:Uncharacterized protein n=1 Tax=Pseudomonas nabeulensis TaxID=2293833 RepID=A0A4Z0AW68_9PSED|nr:hypothetical protein DYL61_19435 [Pseudomonas nabeulensis]